MVYANMGAGVTACVEYVEVRGHLVSFSINSPSYSFQAGFPPNLKLTVLG